MHEPIRPAMVSDAKVSPLVPRVAFITTGATRLPTHAQMFSTPNAELLTLCEEIQ